MSFFLFIFFLIVFTFSEKIEDSRNNIRNLQAESNSFNNIRIHINDDCMGTSSSSENRTDIALIKQSIQKAKNTLEKLIKVKRLTQPLDLNDYSFPSEFHTCTSSGYNNNLRLRVDADLAIIIRWNKQGVEYMDFPRANIIGHLDNDVKKRPLVGTIVFNFNLNNLDDLDEEKVQAVSTIFLHEFTHILGFNKTVFQNNINNLIQLESVQNRVNPGNVEKLFFKGQKALNMAKKYFDYRELQGLELDDSNSKETQDGNSIHWSGRILLGDYMISELYYTEQTISEITLASLEDLGWYEANYFTGGLMRFGKHKGRSFFEKDCVEEARTSRYGLKTEFANEFCSNIYGIRGDIFGTCSSGRQSMGFCYNIYSYDILSRVNSEYIRNRIQNAESGYGNIKIIEYCPYSTSDVNVDDQLKYNYHGNCKFGYGRYTGSDAFMEEVYDETSFCAFSSLLNNKYTEYNLQYLKNKIRPTCYKMSCSEKSLTIHIGKEFIVCPRAGGIIKIDNNYSNYKGLLICPDYNLICTGTVLCNNLFDCVEKGSLVKDSSFDYDYQINQNVSIEITGNNDTFITENIITQEIFELGEEGVCPKFCQQCTANKQCSMCRPDYIYIGTKEGDNETIICSNQKPLEGYYNLKKDGKEFYYKCIENCITCKNASMCEQCNLKYYVNGTGQCVERIPGCTLFDETSITNMPDNGNAPSYIECLNCNETADYYCFDKNKSICNLIPNINMSIYALIPHLNYPCYEKCRDKFIRCETCISSTCLVCNESNLYINSWGNCLQEIDYCERYNLIKHEPECLHCREDQDYYCIKTDRTQCQYISKTDIKSYYKIDSTNDSCVQLCNETYTNECLECDINNGCTKCQEGFFIYQGLCYKNMTGCIDNEIITTDPLKIQCNNCNNNSNYFCLNQDKSICNLMEESNISMHYLLPDINYSCYGLCSNIIENCIQCNGTHCFKCTSGYDVNRKKTYCLIPPTAFKEDVPCQIIEENDESSLNISFNFNQTVVNYFRDLDHTNKVVHYKGNDYTITLYINPNCTEGLLSEGYFKIDTSEINKTLIEEADLDYVYHSFIIYINYNYRSYLRFYDIEQNLLNPETYCQNCLEKKYTMTHNLYKILEEILGTQLTNFVIEKNIDIFSEESEIFTDSCVNLTFYDIDYPIHLRKNLLLIQDNFEPLLCRDVDCELIEYNLTNKTSVCECKLGKSFEDILKEPKFEYIPYKSDIEAKGLSESVKVIKCFLQGIKWRNFKINLAAIICVIIFVLQCIFYISYGCFGKPLVNIDLPPTNANPPKADSPTKIYLFSDWNLSLNKKDKEKEPNVEEEEKVIQPRDDSGDQIMEEEKSLNNDFFSDNISIDTNAGGLFNEKKTNRSLRAAEKNKKVLILLGNKIKKKVSLERSIHEKIESESDETPLRKTKKDDNFTLGRNYWLFLSVKQHIINFFSDITFCHMTETYVPLPLRFIRSLFLVMLSFILNILWLDQKYFEKKWEHFKNKYSLLASEVNNITISRSERILYALSHNIKYIIIDLIIVIFADFIIGVVFFSIRDEVEEIMEKNKPSKMQDLVLKARRNYNIFFAINFILIVVFFLFLAGFGVTYPGGVVDCISCGIVVIIILEIIPFLWSLILALFRYFGYKKKSECMKKFSEYFLY